MLCDKNLCSGIFFWQKKSLPLYTGQALKTINYKKFGALAVIF